MIVRLFASVRKAYGDKTVEVEASELTLAVLMDRLAQRIEGIADSVSRGAVLMAVNRELVDPIGKDRDRMVHSGDEIALMPPLAGG
ncbi:MAG: MoaD/ThiS family protein [Candidatus Riflebacteria bacterium]|nr:MoaD/ThiS family protein [Candidatus Riflebacteria bacterium]